MRPSVGHTVGEDNIKMYLGEICRTVDWGYMAQDKNSAVSYEHSEETWVPCGKGIY
jgi:hypothetical protein